MRYVKTVDYESLWSTLEWKISTLMNDHDWLSVISDDADEQLAHYHKKKMCNEILELMEELQRNEAL